MAAKISDSPALDAEVRRAGLSFVSAIEERFVLRDVFVFGSRARGDHHEQSDIDLAVILEGETGDRTDAALLMADVAVDVLMATGLLVQALPLWEKEFDRPDDFSNPQLILAIKRDGLRL